jgi:hypothetical protein
MVFRKEQRKIMCVQPDVQQEVSLVFKFIF